MQARDHYGEGSEGGQVTPHEISILLHYRVSQEDWPHAHVQGVFDRLVSRGLLAETGGDSPRYCGTARLECFVDYICKLPLPRWQMPELKEVK